MKRWTEEEDNIIKKNFHLKDKDLIKLLPNRSYEAVKTRIKRLRIEGELPQKREFDIIIPDKKFPGIDTPKKVLKLIIEGNRILNECDVRQEHVSPKTPYLGWTGLVIGGDWHIEHYRTNTQAVIDTLTTIGNEPHLYYGFNGDMVDVLNLRFRGLENEILALPVRRLYEVIEYLFSLVPNTLFAVCGCHDNWVRTRAAYDIIEAIQQKLFGYYLGFGGILNFSVGNVIYRIAAHHKFGGESQINPFHPNMKYLRLIDSDCDIVAIAHRHDIVGISKVHWQGKERVFMRSGSAQYKTNYAWKEGFVGATNRYPMVLLNGSKKQMIAGLNYQTGIPYLRHLNKEYEKNNK